MKVAIATKSPEKIKGIKEAFSRFFKEEKVELLPIRADSQVSEQPFDGENFEGAMNRLNSVKVLEKDCDFYVSCEAGIESMGGYFFNVQIVCIFEGKTQSYSWGKSAGWQIPKEHVGVIKETNLDTYLREKGIQSMDELLGSSYSREKFVAQATELALASRKLRESY